MSKLSELLKAHSEWLGTYASVVDDGEFPMMLIKLIDAKKNLLMFTPDDEYATINENGSLGKTEMWYFLDAKSGAELAYGFN
ncbi:MAG: hypothetical protein J5735_00790 [Prevotella sp.]|nr:hypothetical protein [Prevotella sp.]